MKDIPVGTAGGGMIRGPGTSGTTLLALSTASLGLSVCLDADEEDGWFPCRSSLRVVG